MKERWLKIEQTTVDEPPGLQRFFVEPEFGRRPATRLEACVTKRGPGYDWFIGLRFVVGDEVRSSMVVDDWWSSADVLVREAPAGAGVIDQIRSNDVETVDDWSRWFRAQLCGPMSPLYPGLWELYQPSDRRFPDRHRPHHSLFNLPRLAVEVPWRNGFETRCFRELIPTRQVSAPTSGRVKWWRKLARADRLPPVLAMYVQPLLGWIVLDGHDRLLAASLEGKEPDLVLLTAANRRRLADNTESRKAVETSLAKQLEQSVDSRTVDGVNRALIAIYEDHYIERRQRVWHVPGGEVQFRSDIVGVEPDSEASRQVLEQMLLAVPD